MPLARGALRRSAVALQELFADVSVRVRQKEQRKMWFAMPKYFKNLPRHGYQHKWMPTVDSQTGQDLEVDPYDRIAKRGRYREMLRNWQPWYRLDNLLAAKGAPRQAARIAQDLAAHGVRLGDTHSARLMWMGVNAVEDALAKGLPEAGVRDVLYDAKLLTDALRKDHTVALETGAALASLYAVGGQADHAEQLEVELRHLLEDPEEALKAKRDFYEAVTSAHLVRSYDGARALHWLSWMKQLGIRPSSRHVERMLHHMNANGDYVRMFEVKQNMDTLIDLKEHHYVYFLEATAAQGRPDVHSKLVLEMKQQSLLYSTQNTWETMLRAYQKAGDLEGVVSRYRDLLAVRLHYLPPSWKRRGARARRKKVLKRFFRPSARVMLAVLRTFAAHGQMREGYAWWRKNVLAAGWGIGAGGGPAAIAAARNGAGWHGVVLQEMLAGLVAEGATDAAAELYDEIYKKTCWQPQLDGHQLFLDMFERPRTRRLGVHRPEVWRLCSVALAREGRLAEAHFAMTLLHKISNVEGVGGAAYVHLLEACVGRNDNILCATVELMQKRAVPLDGDGYLLLASHLVAQGDVAGAIGVYAEMKTQRRVPASGVHMEGFARLLAQAQGGGGAAAGDLSARQLLEGFYRDVVAQRDERRQAAQSGAAPPLLEASATALPLPDALVPGVAEGAAVAAGAAAASPAAATPQVDPAAGALRALVDAAPWLPDASVEALLSIPEFADLFAGGAGDGAAAAARGRTRYAEVFQSGRALGDALKALAARGEKGRGIVYITDGTVAFHTHLLPEGRVLVPQCVLQQLHNAAGDARASVKERAHFREALGAFREHVDDARGHARALGAAAAPLRAGVVCTAAEGDCGVDPAAIVPRRLVQLAQHVARAHPSLTAAIATNDVEMAAFCARHNVRCEALNRHARQRLGLPPLTEPVAALEGGDAPPEMVAA